MKTLNEFADYLLNGKKIIDFEFQIITNEMSFKEKNDRIRNAANSGWVTLLPREFGRGVDFICKNAEISKIGGLGVIQTYFSEEKSEEIQTRGRNARQGENGKFILILLDKGLEFLMNFEKIKQLNDTNKYIQLDEL